MKEAAVWFVVLGLIAAGLIFVLLPPRESSMVGSGGAPHAVHHAGDGSGEGTGAAALHVGTGEGTGLGSGTGASVADGSGTAAPSDVAVVPHAVSEPVVPDAGAATAGEVDDAAEPPPQTGEPTNRSPATPPEARITLSRRGRPAPEHSVPSVGDTLGFEVVSGLGETRYATLLACSQGSCGVLLADPESDEAHPFEAHLRLPGTLSLRPGGGVVRLLLVVSEDQRTNTAVSAAAEAALATGSAPEGTILDLPVDLGE